jgi:hypothetical protein
VSGLPAKIAALHSAFERAKLPHAFGGALALAWCTQRARGTIDIDVNVFLGSDRAETVFRALPKGVRRSAKDLETVRRDGQVRLWWSEVPIDIFLNTTELHEGLADRTRWETFAGRRIPFLSCRDLAVFKAFFNRTKDWADLEEMHAAGTLDVAHLAGTLAASLGSDDERLARLLEIPKKAIDAE